jgi:hypothetical protein
MPRIHGNQDRFFVTGVGAGPGGGTGARMDDGRSATVAESAGMLVGTFLGGGGDGGATLGGGLPAGA